MRGPTLVSSASGASSSMRRPACPGASWRSGRPVAATGSWRPCSTSRSSPVSLPCAMATLPHPRCAAGAFLSHTRRCRSAGLVLHIARKQTLIHRASPQTQSLAMLAYGDRHAVRLRQLHQLSCSWRQSYQGCKHLLLCTPCSPQKVPRLAALQPLAMTRSTEQRPALRHMADAIAAFSAETSAEAVWARRCTMAR